MSLALPVLVTLLTVSLAPAPAAVAAGETHTLTVRVLDHNGAAPCDGCANDVGVYQDTYNRDNPEGQAYYGISRSRQTNGEATLEVPTGVYTLITNLADAADYIERTRRTYIVEVEVPIDGDTTIVLDAREAVLMKQPVVPESDVQVRDHAFALGKQYVDRSHGWGNYGQPELSGAHFTGLRAVPPTDLYLTPYPAPTLTKLVVTDRWTLAEPQSLKPDPFDSNPGAQRAYSDTPAYMYHVARTYPDGFTAETLDLTYSESDFVATPVTYHSDYDDALIATRHHMTTFFYSGSQAEVVLFRPGKVVQHYLADDQAIWKPLDWLHREEALIDQIDSGSTSVFQMRAYDAFPAAEAGTVRPAQDRHSGPLHYAVTDTTDNHYIDLFATGPFPANDAPDLLAGMARGGEAGDRFLRPLCATDNTGPGPIRDSLVFYCAGLGDTTWRMHNLDTGTELVQDGAVFTGMAPGRATYRLEQHTDTGDFEARYGHLYRTEPPVSTVWTFTSAPSNEELPWYFSNGCASGGRVCQVQPVIQLRYDLGLDTYNRAPAGGEHTFSITAAHPNDTPGRPGVIKDMTVEASFDDGRTWQTVAVTPLRQPNSGGPGEFQVTIDHPDLAATGGFVGLRVTATDTAGGTVEQTVNRAYMLRGWEHVFADGDRELRVNTLTDELQFAAPGDVSEVKYDPNMTVETLPTGAKVIRINYTDEDLTVVGEFFPDSGAFAATVKTAKGPYVLDGTR